MQTLIEEEIDAIGGADIGLGPYTPESPFTFICRNLERWLEERERNPL
jgi:hypothetical protein